MSGTLRGTGLFPTTKRRSGDFVTAGSKKHKSNSRAKADKSNDAGSSSTASGVVAGAVAPVKSNTRIQEAIHEEVQYSREGKRRVPEEEKTVQVFRFVKEAFVIPDDFDLDHRYGPLSGVSHELRVVSAFMAGQLEARSQSYAGTKMCLECAKKGHFPRYCPSKLLS